MDKQAKMEIEILMSKARLQLDQSSWKKLKCLNKYVQCSSRAQNFYRSHRIELELQC